MAKRTCACVCARVTPSRSSVRPKFKNPKFYSKGIFKIIRIFGPPKITRYTVALLSLLYTCYCVHIHVPCEMFVCNVSVLIIDLSLLFTVCSVQWERWKCNPMGIINRFISSILLHHSLPACLPFSLSIYNISQSLVYLSPFYFFQIQILPY